MHSTMNRLAIRALLSAAVALGMLVCSGSAKAQTTDVLKVTYFDNNGGDGEQNARIHVLNPGSGAFCADVYVFRADQELTECCSCPISANGELHFDVVQVTLSPGDGGGVPVNGSIQIIADSTPLNCTDASAAAPTPTPTLRAWSTHVNFNTASQAFDSTETPFLDATLSAGQLSELSGRCAAIQANDSGHGRCDTICEPGEPAVKKAAK